MTLTGENFIGFQNSAKSNKTFQAFASATNQFLQGNFAIATSEELEKVLSLASNAFPVYKEISAAKRADFLDAIAAEIYALGDMLIERCSQESSLPVARIAGERNRTCGQLQLFAQLLRDGWWVDARIDTAQPERKPLPRTDIRRMLVPIGPVAVFGASNFPLAFSTAGGDTASALAAGCPVVVKAHSSHPGTNELVSSAIIKAAKDTGMPEGVFSSVYLSHEDAVSLVKNPVIKAVGFTGSRSVGMRLFNAAVSRPDPIPVYAEMSAINPVVLMESALKKRKDAIAKELAASLILGAGQFCTCPGLVLMTDTDAALQFRTAFAEQIAAVMPAPMLNKNIHKAYYEGVKTFEDAAEIFVLAKSSTEPVADRYEAQPVVHMISGADFIANKQFSEEIFGPATLLVICKDEAELQQALQSLEGQLTATLHAVDDDAAALKPIINIISEKAGRVIYGGYPTGVEVCHSMQHGGPFPATTDGRATSVGTAAIYRFVRPVAYQAFPDALLPEALQNANPLHILRLVNGNWTTDAIE
ncbi:aldehyde dehydrogenase (NADP(+)) [Ilyomonas limi]|uniref:Aldehyde dehydrogenase (NADP(+)) n=1 Tax=Ilyomonas limi TaxID=2575867 RepID=A0A4U3L063_9BACT|nr:aldehyde dehydrogenase (NADP(+)) [Ilyomonas limi]TKK68335.1 aldehyde dehydrogenase (NADP(+)) [Ilyomonas limi]